MTHFPPRLPDPEPYRHGPLIAIAASLALWCLITWALL
jgi:hypothetical protein